MKRLTLLAATLMLAACDQNPQQSGQAAVPKVMPHFHQIDYRVEGMMMYLPNTREPMPVSLLHHGRKWSLCPSAEMCVLYDYDSREFYLTSGNEKKATRFDVNATRTDLMMAFAAIPYMKGLRDDGELTPGKYEKACTVAGEIGTQWGWAGGQHLCITSDGIPLRSTSNAAVSSSNPNQKVDTAWLATSVVRESQRPQWLSIPDDYTRYSLPRNGEFVLFVDRDGGVRAQATQSGILEAPLFDTAPPTDESAATAPAEAPAEP